MADRKISDLTALTAPAAGDYLPIVDISEVAAASKNKRITIEELFRGTPDGTAAAPAIAPESDPNTGIYSSGADQLSIATNGTERLRIDSAGQIEAVSLGTAAAPTFSFTGDPNTGIYSPGADQLAISTNGTGRLFIDASGNVGFNDASPSSNAIGAGGPTVVLRGTSGAQPTRSGGLCFISQDGTSKTIAYHDSGIFYLQSTAATAQVFLTNNTERLRITSAGLVGLGTSSPIARLHVTGGDSVFGAGNLTRILNASQVIDFTNAAQDTYVAGRLNGLNLKLYTNTGTGIDIDSTGLVGIGTSSPGQRLHVSGSGEIAATVGSVYPLTLWTSTAAVEPAIYTKSGSALRFGTTTDGIAAAGFTERVRITSAGLVGIGTTSPGSRLEVGGESAPRIGINSTGTGTAGVLFQGTGTTYGSIIENISTGELAIKAGASGQNSYFITFGTNDGTERARIDSSGRLLVGTSTARSNLIDGTGGSALQVEGTSQTTSTISSVRNSADAQSPWLILGKSRSATVNGNTVVSSGDNIGVISFDGSDGTKFLAAAQIYASVDGTPGSNDMPGRLVFSTTADGAASPTERMRIQSSGTVLINKTSSSFTTSGFEYRSSNELLLTSTTTNISMNRLSTDGDLVDFFQDTIKEGSISVSGTTVSYNGAHLSRWSQLPSGAERTQILRGSVLSNIDEMCEWGNEDNEQLNRMKVSDVEGDKNVSGVFQAWDDDDDTYTDDFYCAMTGDFIIRIAEGVTVERGDLLMSAGDGTAKPQDDDIIRSKTIAKVTSTNVSCTYDDGSYCVPCVLMAC